MRRVFAVLGGLLVVAGVVLALIPVSVTLKATNIFDPALSSAKSFDCGGVWGSPDVASPLGTKLSDALVACDDALGTRSVLVYVMLGVGVLMLVGAALYKPASTPSAQL